MNETFNSTSQDAQNSTSEQPATESSSPKFEGLMSWYGQSTKVGREATSRVLAEIEETDSTDTINDTNEDQPIININVERTSNPPSTDWYSEWLLDQENARNYKEARKLESWQRKKALISQKEHRREARKPLIEQQRQLAASAGVNLFTGEELATQIQRNRDSFYESQENSDLTIAQIESSRITDVIASAQKLGYEGSGDEMSAEMSNLLDNAQYLFASKDTIFADNEEVSDRKKRAIIQDELFSSQSMSAHFQRLETYIASDNLRKKSFMKHLSETEGMSDEEIYIEMEEVNNLLDSINPEGYQQDSIEQFEAYFATQGGGNYRNTMPGNRGKQEKDTWSETTSYVHRNFIDENGLVSAIVSVPVPYKKGNGIAVARFFEDEAAADKAISLLANQKTSKTDYYHETGARSVRHSGTPEEISNRVSWLLEATEDTWNSKNPRTVERYLSNRKQQASKTEL